MTKISIELSRFPPAECNKTLTTAWTVYTRHNALSRTGNGIKHRRPSLYRVRIRLHRGQKRHNSQDRLQTRKQKSNKFLFMSAATLKPIRLKCYLAPTKWVCFEPTVWPDNCCSAHSIRVSMQCSCKSMGTHVGLRAVLHERWKRGVSNAADRFVLQNLYNTMEQTTPAICCHVWRR